MHDRRSQHLGNEEEPGSGAVGRKAEPVFQIAVDGDEVHPVEQRYQNECYNYLSCNESQCHLHVAESGCGHHSRDRDECHSGHGRAYHGDCDHIPGLLAVAAEEAGVVGFSSCEPGNEQDYRKVC